MPEYVDPFLFKWNELKEAFRNECATVSERSALSQFECDESSETSFEINRFISGHAILALRFTFEPTIPRIVWQDFWNKKIPVVLNLTESGANVFFTVGSSGVILGSFVAQRMIALTKH